MKELRRGLQRALAQKVKNQLWLHIGGETFVFETEKRASRTGQKGAKDSNQVAAPMPGKIMKVLATVGQKVEKDTVLVVMEAMKMEYSLKAPRATVVTEIACSEGDQVQLGQTLVKIESAKA